MLALFAGRYEWWRWAATLPRAVSHVVKTEDDATLNLRNLAWALRPWMSTRELYFGGFAYAG